MMDDHDWPSLAIGLIIGLLIGAAASPFLAVPNLTFNGGPLGPGGGFPDAGATPTDGDRPGVVDANDFVVVNGTECPTPTPPPDGNVSVRFCVHDHTGPFPNGTPG